MVQRPRVVGGLLGGAVVGIAALLFWIASGPKTAAFDPRALSLDRLAEQLEAAERVPDKAALLQRVNALLQRPRLSADEALGVLLEVLKAGDGAFLTTAAEALVRLGDPTAIPALIEVFRFSPARVGQALLALSGQTFSLGDAKPWYTWWWKNRLPVFEGFDDWKLALYVNNVPGLGQFLHPGMNYDLPLEHVVWGGIAPGAIPALDEPSFVDAAQAGYLKDDDIVFGVELNGDVRAYPLRIMDWHEVVNDTVGGEAVVLSYCPLCGTALLYGRRVGEEIYTFQTSGLLYESNKLMVDDLSLSLWPNLLGVPLMGPLSGSGIALKRFALTQTTWARWRKEHPQTRVLDLNTGYAFNYDLHEAYDVYRLDKDTLIPVSSGDGRLPPKAWVLGLLGGDQAKAYPLQALETLGVLNDEVGGMNVVLFVQATTRSTLGYHPPEVRAYERKEHVFVQGMNDRRTQTSDGDVWTVEEGALLNPRTGERLERVPGEVGYWFAWRAFHPDTAVYENP